MDIFTNKKGDLSLSVNAIVILVIAIIFLGLAIGFTTKLIGSSKDKLMSGIDNVDISTPANSDNPLVFDGKLEVKANDKSPLRISVYNIDSTEFTEAKPSITTCYKDDGSTPNGVATADAPSIIAAPAKISPYKEQRFQAILSATTPGTYLCKIGVTVISPVTTPATTSSIKKQVTIIVSP